MNMYKEIWIDIRDEHELAESQIVSPNDEILVINIPSRNMFANVDWIKSMEANGVKVTLICKSANRSQNVKKLYFSTNENIVSLDGGISNPGITIKKLNSWGGFGIQQILQLVFVIILTCILVASFYLQINKLRYAMVGVIFFILYQIVSKSCLIGKYVPLKSTL
jgi:rhodanese-related sulfurtransferase